MSKVASLFASMGFDVDFAGVDRFEKTLKSVRDTSNEVSRSLRTTNRQLGQTSRKMKSVTTASNAYGKSNNLGSRYSNLADHVKKSETALARFGRVMKIIEPRIDSNITKIDVATQKWKNLESAIRGANGASSQARSGGIPTRRGRAPNPNGSSFNNYGNYGNNGYGNRRGYGGGGHGTGFGAGMGGGAIGGALSRFLPAGMLIGGLSSLAVGVNEIRKAGQEQQRMENILLFSSKKGEFEGNLEYVRELSKTYALDTSELGRAYAQVTQSSGETLSKGEREKMFKDMSLYMATTGAGQEDQKLIFKAVNQMFSLGRIMAEEMNQLTERGIPRKMVHDVVKDVYGLKTTEEVLDLQKAGKIETDKIIPIVFERFAKQAVDSGAYDKMRNSSQFAQNNLQRALKDGSKQLMDAGLDRMLKVLFDVMAGSIPIALKLAETIFAITKGISGLVGVLGSFVSGSPAMVGSVSGILLVLGVLLGLLSKNSGQVSTLARVFTRALSLMGTAIKRFPLVALLLSVLWLFKEFGKHMNGEDNWISVFISYLELAMVWVGNFFEFVKLNWDITMNIFKNFSLSDVFGGFMDGLTTVGQKIKDAFTFDFNPLRREMNSLQADQMRLQAGIPAKGGSGSSMFNAPTNSKMEVVGNASLTLKDSQGRTQQNVTIPLMPAGNLHRNGVL